MRSEGAPLPPHNTNRHWLLRATLLLLWAGISFGACYWARDLAQVALPGWGGSLGYWLASQGAVLVFIGIVVLYATVMNRHDRHDQGRQRPPGGAPDA